MLYIKLQGSLREWSENVNFVGMKKLLCLVLLLFSLHISAENFFVTTKVELSRRDDGMSYSVSADFPKQGNDKAVAEIKKWMCERLCEYDSVPADAQNLDEDSFKELLSNCCRLYFENNSSGCREEIELFRSYEDEDLVTYQLKFASWDKPDGDSWKDEDCVSVSKVDGHRIQANEVFKCNDDKIKELMWQWRGDLPVEDMSPADLIVGDVAYIDGWILVIGPANGYTGATYRIRYQAAEPYLKLGKNGDYYDEE